MFVEFEMFAMHGDHSTEHIGRVRNFLKQQGKEDRNKEREREFPSGGKPTNTFVSS